jgi:hypothetical protein
MGVRYRENGCLEAAFFDVFRLLQRISGFFVIFAA